MPIGKKKDIDVPNIIKNCEDKKIIAAFLRGIVDTDFCLALRKTNKGYNPSLEGASASKNLILSLYKLFKKLGIDSSLELDTIRFDKRVNKYYKINKIIIRKKTSLINSLKLIKSRNKKYQDRIKKMGPMEFESTTSA